MPEKSFMPKTNSNFSGMSVEDHGWQQYKHSVSGELFTTLAVMIPDFLCGAATCGVFVI